MSKVSIIIPAYNGEKFLPRSIGSVLAQTFADWELIIVDDGSTDGTKKVIEDFVKKDPRISYYYEKNSGGPARPKNFAMQYAKGEYIAYLDQDDEWMPEKLKKQIRIFEKDENKKIGLVTCDVLLAKENGVVFGKYNNPDIKSLFPDLLTRSFIYSNSSVIVQRDVVEKVGERDERLKQTEDWDMWIRIAWAGYDFGFVREPLLKYYFHDINTTKVIGYPIRAKNAETIFNKHQAIYKKYNFFYFGFFRLGVMFFLADDVKKARNYFVQSIRQKKYFVPAYIGYAVSFTGRCGDYIVQALIFLYRILHGKKYFTKQ
jgi:glycosyltransferase involved in cell wall biosynthesis